MQFQSIIKPHLDRLSSPRVMWSVLGLLVAVNLYSWLRYFQPAPLTDMVDLEWFLMSWSWDRDGLAPLITYPDNEHRAFLPVLLQAVDHKLLGSTGLFLILVHIGCFATLAAGFARHAVLAFHANPRVMHWAAGAMVLVMLWSAHWNNIIRTKQTHTCLAVLFVTVAFWLAARFDARRKPSGAPKLDREDWIMLGALSVAIWEAVWSFTAGLAVIPVLIAFAFIRNWGWAARIVITLASALALVSWHWASQAGDTGNAPSGAASVLTYLLYGVNVLSGLFHDALAGDEVVAPFIGAAFLVLSGPLIWFGLRLHKGADPALDDKACRAVSFFTLFAMWAIVCAIAITASRAQFGADQAFVSRYLPFGTVFAVATAMLAMLFRHRLNMHLRRAVLGVSVFYLIAVFAVSPRGWNAAADHNRDVALGAVAGALVIDDAQFTLYPGLAGGRVPQVLDHYIENDGSFFARDWGGWLKNGTAAAQLCDGVTGKAAFIELGEGRGFRMTARVDGAAPLWVGLVTAQGDVFGLARRGSRFRTPPTPALEEPLYAGFARFVDRGDVIAAALLKDGRRCAIETAS